MSLLERTETGEWPQIVMPDGPRATARRILAETAARHGVAPIDMIGDRRYRPLVASRREAAWLIARDTDLSLLQISNLLRKDHTSVINAIRCMNEQRSANVRGLGSVPLAKRERDLRAARKAVAVSQRKDEEDALVLFAKGLDTVEIAKAMKWRLPRAANALARARDRERATR